MEWMPIESAPTDRDIELKGLYVPSPEAYRNGARECETFGYGSALWLRQNGKFFFSGILGGDPTHWREING